MSFDYKKHYNWEPFETNDGSGNKKLDEPVPVFPKRTGDLVITGAGLSKTGQNNNAQICIGRDRAPFWIRPDGVKENPSKDEERVSRVSGFSDHMRAGAIDIVVGRGMPYPVSDWGDGAQPLLPQYTWQPSGKLKTNIKSNIIGKNNESIEYPTYSCDGARIYISQTCYIDEYFNINHKTGPSNLHPKVDSDFDPDPSSAIMMKADKLRMHSRRDIKIVAGGDLPEGAFGFGTDSHDNSIKTAGGVHLISGNGLADNAQHQQSMVLGENLVECLNAIIAVLQQYGDILYGENSDQMRTNVTQGNHVHGAASGVTTTPDPICSIQTKTKLFSSVKTILGVCTEKMHNLTQLQSTYLRPGSKSGPNNTYICSSYHTLN